MRLSPGTCAQSRPPHRMPDAPNAACGVIAEFPRRPPATPPPRVSTKTRAPRSLPYPRSDIRAAASLAQVPVEKLRRPPERVDVRLIAHEDVTLFGIINLGKILALVN